MKKMLDINLMPVLTVLLLLVVASCLGQFGGGSGTEEDPWLIETAEHLDNIRDYLGADSVGKHFLQTVDVNLGVSPWNDGEGWIPLGNNVSNSFRGSYDGNGYVIDGLYINRPNADNQGLFRSINHGSLTNITLTNAYILGRNYLSILALSADDSEVSNCITNGNIVGEWHCAGLIGSISETNITNCSSSVSISALGYLGGLIKSAQFSYIENSSAETFIQITEEFTNYYIGSTIGGLVAMVAFNTELSNCYSTGNITGNIGVGGLIGSIEENSSIFGCYSMTVVNGVSQVGGLIGYSLETNIRDSYSSGSISGRSHIGGFVGAIVRNTVISDSYSSGNVISSENYTGGLIGYCDTGSNIEKCFSTGVVQGHFNVGGLIGYINNTTAINNSFSSSNTIGTNIVAGLIAYAKNLTITNSYSIGSVNSTTNGGGLVAGSEDSDYLNCYWNIETSGINTSEGGEGKTTTDMTYPYENDTFANWDFEEIWHNDTDFTINDGYPYLREIEFVSVDNQLAELPTAKTLSIYPNPFNPETTIRFSLCSSLRSRSFVTSGDVSLSSDGSLCDGVSFLSSSLGMSNGGSSLSSGSVMSSGASFLSSPDTSGGTNNLLLAIYNIKGQLIKTVSEFNTDNDGYYYDWNGKDNDNHFVASGVYFAVIKAEGKVIEKGKMLLLK